MYIGLDKSQRFTGFINKKQFLEDILGRLRNEAGIPLKAYISHNQIPQNGKVGFWGMVRLVMPIIETISHVNYGISNSWERGTKLLSVLNVPYPALTWLVFRNSLVHYDEIAPIFDDITTAQVGWFIYIGGGHVKAPLAVTIDVKKLYEDLEQYIIHSISNTSKGTIIEIPLNRVTQTTLKSNKNIANLLKQEYFSLFGKVIT